MNPHRYVFVTSQVCITLTPLLEPYAVVVALFLSPFPLQTASMVQSFVCCMEKLMAENKQQQESKAQGSGGTQRDMRARRPF
jgi:hypothetical protein